MIVILTGKSGSGKDSVHKKLVEDGFIPIVSSTTRPMRDGEIDGVDYYFTDNKTFEDKIKSGAIFEYREYNGSNGKVYYGSEKITLEDNKNYTVVLDLDGTEAFFEAYGRENCLAVHILVDDKERLCRALKREFPQKQLDDMVLNNKMDTDRLEKFHTEWNTRLKADTTHFTPERVKKDIDCVVSNEYDSLEKTVENIKKSMYERI